MTQRRLTAVLATLVIAGCAAASGYDPKRYAAEDAGAPDPDTAPLASAPRTTIPDPKKPPLPPPPPPAPAPAPVVEEDAGPPADAGTKPKPTKPAAPATKK